jgi:cytochrome c oxidase subunit 1
MWLLGVTCVGISSMLGSVNYMTTIIQMRAPGMTMFRLPMTIWAMFITAVLQAFALPVLTAALFMQLLDRTVRTGFFIPEGLIINNEAIGAGGGQTLLWQHLFWFYSHPAVYIMILPSMGVISEIIPCFSRKRIFGYHFVALSSLAIAVFGFLVWAHHMFVAGISVYAALIFSLLSYSVAVPSAVKVFNWTATMYKGSIHYDAPMLYAYGFLGLFTMGGLTGLFLAALGIDVHVTDTYFVIAHFHYIMVGGAVMGYLGGLHFWWPKISGKLYPEGWARLAALIVFIGFNLTFFPQFILGYLGMPRRYFQYPGEFQVLNVLSTAGATVLGVGYLLPMIYFLWSMRYGKPAPDNPWKAAGLEWQTQSPPTTFNFEQEPVVTWEAYNYDEIDTGHKEEAHVVG